MDLFGAIERVSKTTSASILERETEDFKEEIPPKKHCTTSDFKRDEESKTIASRPESFSFLHPCPICHGRYFTYGKNGGFFCDTCQPDITGRPAYATGKELPKFHTTEPIKTISYSPEEDCFHIGFPWIMENLEELLATGWTRPELFRRSRHKWCIGNWGLAWAAPWTRPGVKVVIKKSGRVTFTFRSGGRTTTQSAYPGKCATIKD